MARGSQPRVHLPCKETSGKVWRQFSMSRCGRFKPAASVTEVRGDAKDPTMYRTSPTGKNVSGAEVNSH